MLAAEIEAKVNHRKDQGELFAPSTPQTPLPARMAWYDPCRRLAEGIYAAVLLVLTAPLIALAALLVKLTSPGPVLYSQTRLGRGGKPYTIYKIRTMVHNCEKASGPQWCTKQDPRVTRVGYFLRKAHLDELPQLWNVLRGDMSLVGPRPERPEFVPHLEKSIPNYADRLLVRPGVTGLAQVQLPADTDLSSVRRKLKCDLYYVRNVGPWLDLQILFATAFYLVRIPFAVPRRLLGVPAVETIERLTPEGAESEALNPQLVTG
jgi:lipopolysaccharide/colanic/teichoic acid biosynthesis glycosyltransferase